MAINLKSLQNPLSLLLLCMSSLLADNGSVLQRQKGRIESNVFGKITAYEYVFLL